MTTLNTSHPPSYPLPRCASAGPAARTTLGLLQRLAVGTLVLQTPEGQTLRFGQYPPLPANTADLHGAIALNNWKVCTAALKSGDIGFAEAYLAGDWHTPDLVGLLKVLLGNRQQVQSILYGHWAGRWLHRIQHWRNRNSRANSRKNVHAHYDLGNDFYALWLDSGMNYSSAWFQDDRGQSLAQAQLAKLRRALTMVGLQPGQRLLEIGCGWGALAELAASAAQARVTGVTLSTEQLALAQARMAKAGLAGQVELRLQDYRDIQDPPFDAICSIEMIEAVGRAYWPRYFATLARLLKPGGRACVQSIVIDDALFARYIDSTDFIQQYIFPGGCLPCPREFRAQANAAGLRVVDELAFGSDYAETLKRWRERFLAHTEAVLQRGFDARFIRLWEFYLAYCEAAFAMGDIDVVQYTLEK